MFLKARLFGKWIIGPVGFLGTSVTGFELTSKFVKDSNNQTMVLIFYILLLVTAVFIISGIRQWQVMRKEKYANITSKIHNIMHKIRDLNTFIHACSQDTKSINLINTTTQHEFINILDRVVDIFVSVTSTKCRACIKLTYELDRNLYIYTLARDRVSMDQLHVLDETRASNNQDPLNRNKEFANLFEPSNQNWFFHCNDLTRRSGFRSTSVAAYAPEYGDSPPIAKPLFERIRARKLSSWPLPYKSTIACVIRQGPIHQGVIIGRPDGHPTIVPEVVGFLTVDSESRGVFEARWDVQIMLAIADALYPCVRAYLDLQNRANQSNSQEAPALGTDGQR